MMDVDEIDVHGTMRLSTQQYDESRHFKVLFMLTHHDLVLPIIGSRTFIRQGAAATHTDYRRSIHGGNMRDSDTKRCAISKS